MRLAIVTAALLSSTPAFALDAITYKGTLGRSAIIVELTDPSEGMMIGRYSYLHVGGDIPLHNLDGLDSFELAEEAPCSEATCQPDADDTITNPPIGGRWSLNFSDDQNSLNGTWSSEGKTGKSLPISLTEIGRRALPDDVTPQPLELADSAFLAIFANNGPVTTETAPYEFAKMDVPLTEAEVEDFAGSTFRYVSDPRSKFAFPRVIALSDGSSPDAINRALASRHAAINVAAFSCLDNAYAGLSWSPHDISMEGGSLGDYDYETIEVSYLSPMVMGWTESGSTWCGGAHPNNHFNSFLRDVRTGGELALGRIFRDWTATIRIDSDGDDPIDQAAALEAPEDYFWSAGRPLIDYVLANYTTSDPDHAAECGIEELIATNLGVRFGRDDTAIFSLVDLPHAIHACTEDVLLVPLADIPELLAPTAADYFPGLAR